VQSTRGCESEMKEHTTHPMKLKLNDHHKEILVCSIKGCDLTKTTYKRKNHTEIKGI